MPEAQQEERSITGAWPTFVRAWGVLLLMLAAVLTAAAVWLERREESIAIATWEGRMAGSARTQSRAVAAWAAERAADARMALANPVSRAWISGGRDAPVVEYLNAARDAHGYRAGRLVTGSREVMVGVVADDVERRLREGGEPPAGQVSWEVFELPGGVVRVIVRHTSLGAPHASAALVIDPATSLFPIVEGASYGSLTGETQLVVRSGESILFFSPGRDARTGQPLARARSTGDRLAAGAALAGTVGFGRYLNYRGTPVFAVTRRDSATGWGLVQKVDAAEVLAPLPRARFIIGLLALLIFALAVFAAATSTIRGRRRELRQRFKDQDLELAGLRLRAQAFAAESRAQRLARLLDDAGDEIYVINAETLMIELANRQAADALGYDMESLCRRTPLDLAPGLDPGGFRVAMQDMRDGRLASWAVETEHQRRDGSRYSVALRTRYSTIEDPPVFVAVAVDITNRRVLEASLRQAQKMEAVGRLAGGVAHDFNNILTVIQSSGTLALEMIAESDPVREDVEQMIDAARRAATLTAQLLAFSRRQIIQLKVESLNAIVTSIQPMLERLLGEDVDLVVQLAAAPDLVLVDRGQMDQVVMNLAINARDAMPHGGRLTIETSTVELTQRYADGHPTVVAGPHVMLAVSDTGGGMDTETAAHVFEPFFTTKGRGAGTGLGLSTVFGIVKQSGGNIWVYSELGQGTSFKAYLPLARESEMAAPLVETLPLEVATRGHETILLVEDDEGIRRLAARVLSANGYTVIQAGNGEEGLAAAQAENGPIHLLLTDVVMPRLGGRGLADRVAMRRPQMRVLYMSGFTDNAIVHHNVLERGLDFLQKPFTPARLLEAVRKTLDRT